ncbi:hypothetical protein OBBRIDRAFT_804738 [Obba rivulosa]|uniref:Uncharacterized protein n=1 Tax=Obba rivulosa TaxID=1052685 RepID=A0A8E2AUC6_9APHY|nr:hypothetical protein OBBRIDRAFT_804738 [Obba rivulosa]
MDNTLIPLTLSPARHIHKRLSIEQGVPLQRIYSGVRKGDRSQHGLHENGVAVDLQCRNMWDAEEHYVPALWPNVLYVAIILIPIIDVQSLAGCRQRKPHEIDGGETNMGQELVQSRRRVEYTERTERWKRFFGFAGHERLREPPTSPKRFEKRGLQIELGHRLGKRIPDLKGLELSARNSAGSHHPKCDRMVRRVRQERTVGGRLQGMHRERKVLLEYSLAHLETAPDSPAESRCPWDDSRTAEKYFNQKLVWCAIHVELGPKWAGVA